MQKLITKSTSNTEACQEKNPGKTREEIDFSYSECMFLIHGGDQIQYEINWDERADHMLQQLKLLPMREQMFLASILLLMICKEGYYKKLKKSIRNLSKQYGKSQRSGSRALQGLKNSQWNPDYKIGQDYDIPFGITVKSNRLSKEPNDYNPDWQLINSPVGHKVLEYLFSLLPITLLKSRFPSCRTYYKFILLRVYNTINKHCNSIPNSVMPTPPHDAKRFFQRKKEKACASERVNDKNAHQQSMHAHQDSVHRGGSALAPTPKGFVATANPDNRYAHCERSKTSKLETQAGKDAFAFLLMSKNKHKRLSPYKGTIATEINSHIKTVERALNNCKELSILDWISGKKYWRANIYLVIGAFSTPLGKKYVKKVLGDRIKTLSLSQCRTYGDYITKRFGNVTKKLSKTLPASAPRDFFAPNSKKSKSNEPPETPGIHYNSVHAHQNSVQQGASGYAASACRFSATPNPALDYEATYYEEEYEGTDVFKNETIHPEQNPVPPVSGKPSVYNQGEKNPEKGMRAPSTDKTERRKAAKLAYESIDERVRFLFVKGEYGL